MAIDATKKTRALLYVGAIASGLISCSKAEPIVVESKELPSPSGSLVATIEVVDNGLGFGLGALYDEIHVSHAPKFAFRHGDPDPSVVFYSESLYNAGSPPQIMWKNDRLLRVILDPASHPGRQKSKVDGVYIEYIVRVTKGAAH